MVGLVAKVKVKEGKMDEALNLFRELMKDVNNEPGTLSYTVNKDTTEPNVIFVLERYQDGAALKAHMSAPYFGAFFARMGGLVDGNPEMRILEEVASKL
jgi:quinol monooxygenase YgiN